jgi:UDP-glucuronate 4-epimerase
VRVLDHPPERNDKLRSGEITPAVSRAPYRVYNIGNSSPVPLLEFIETLERALGVRAIREFRPMQPGDVYTTYADVSALERDVGFAPATTLETGLRRFVDWYREFHATDELREAIA